MPVIGIPVDHLNRLIGQPIGREQLLEHLQHLGCDIEGFATLARFSCGVCGHINEVTESEDAPAYCERCGFDFRSDATKRRAIDPIDVVRMELLAVRPDIFDVGGLARCVRGYLAIEEGLQRYFIAPPQTHVEVDPLLQTDAAYRPFIACARVFGIEFDDDLIRVLMKLQENLHWALGRNRKLASIGVYDLDTTTGPYRYTTIGPDETRFVPLGVTDGSASTPRDVLAEHPKGKAYAHLLESHERYPWLVDANGAVLSMPPIINSEATRVHHGSNNLFIDVTGTVERVVQRTLNIVVTSLCELCPEIRVEQVEVRYPDGRVALTPDLTPQRVTISAQRTSKLIGFEQSPDQLAELLRRMRHDVKVEGDRLEVDVAAYRNDILHERDLQEDAAIAYGYHNLVPSLVRSMTVGQEHPNEAFASQARQILCGQGFLEVMTLMLVSVESAYHKLRLEPSESHVVIEYPVSQEQSIVRESLVPGLLETLSLNAHNDLPQQIFEVGHVTELAPTRETGARDYYRAAAAIISAKAGFAEIKQTAEALLRELGLRASFVPSSHATFIEGRAATIVVGDGPQGKPVGVIGEVHPEVLESFNLVHPAALFEVDLAALR